MGVFGKFARWVEKISNALIMDRMQDMSTSLNGKYLIATPSLGDPRFHRAVVYMCSHDADHAFGVVINKAKGGLVISDLIEQIGIEGAVTVADTPVLDGGPMGHDRGIVLHSPDYFSDETSEKLSDTLSLTNTKNVLESFVTNKAPSKAALIVGYAGWGSGQIEREIVQNAWLVCEADEALIFDTDMDEKWHRALDIIGISPESLSFFGGNA